MKAIPLWVKLLGAIGVVAAVCVGLAFVPTGDVAYAPVAPIDLEGKIQVDGRPAEAPQGHYYLVGVTERPVNLLQRLLLDVSDPDVDFDTAPAGLPPGGPAPADVTSMDQAKQVAAGVAFDLTGEPTNWIGTGATVAATAPGTPAAANLQRGDVITSVNGRTGARVDTSVEVSRAISGLPVGSKVVLGVQRAGVAVRPALRTIAPEPDDTINSSRIGVALSTIGLKIDLPRPVAIDSGEVVGPSAGLAFALYIYDSRSKVDLLHGRHVVVSGALAPDGQVLPVGRMRQKAISAQEAHRDLLIVPRANAAEARAAVKGACGEGEQCVEVVPVRSAAEAVQLLRLEDAALTARLARLTT